MATTLRSFQAEIDSFSHEQHAQQLSEAKAREAAAAVGQHGHGKAKRREEEKSKAGEKVERAEKKEKGDERIADEVKGEGHEDGEDADAVQPTLEVSWM